MEYDFSFVDRKNTDCLKFDFARERGHRDDCLSYWVADMDFKTAPEILSALHDRIDHGIFGYTNIKDHYFDAVAGWLQYHHNYTMQREWLVETPGVVFALATAITAFTRPGDPVLIQTPVYYPFRNVIVNNGRRVVSSPLLWEKDADGQGSYVIDFDHFEKTITENHIGLFLLCNPHNPGGKSWSKDELERIAQICVNHQVIVISDEIHADFVWEPKHHTVFASISPEAEQLTVTCTSPSKSFNLAGLQVSNIFIANGELRQKFWKIRDCTGYDEPSLLGLTAAEAAYRLGEDWFTEARRYISANLDFAVGYIARESEGILKCRKPDATYLLWIDCSDLPFDDTEQNRRITQKGNLWLDPGNIFGQEGRTFQRINVATSRSYLEKGLERFVQCLLYN